MSVDILKLIDEIYACAAEPANWENAAVKMARALGAHAVAMQYQHIDDPQCGMHLIAGFDPAWTADYLQNWDPINPWRLRAMDAARAAPVHARYRAFHTSGLVAPAPFRRTEVFNESLKKADLYDCVGIPLFGSDDTMWLAFFCGKRKSLFNLGDLKLASILAPHIARAAHFGAAIEHAAPYNLKGRFSDPLAKTSGHVVAPRLPGEVDRTAPPDLPSELGLRLRFRVRRMPTARVRAEDAATLNAVGSLIGAPSARRADISAFQPSPLSYAVHGLQRMKPLIALERRRRDLPDATTLMREFDLTQSEAEIALMIVHGLTPVKIAETRQNRLSTVRWHIKQIYAKLLVSDRVALVRKILKNAA